MSFRPLRHGTILLRLVQQQPRIHPRILFTRSNHDQHTPNTGFDAPLNAPRESGILGGSSSDPAVSGTIIHGEQNGQTDHLVNDLHADLAELAVNDDEVTPTAVAQAEPTNEPRMLLEPTESVHSAPADSATLTAGEVSFEVVYFESKSE